MTSLRKRSVYGSQNLSGLPKRRSSSRYNLRSLMSSNALEGESGESPRPCSAQDTRTLSDDSNLRHHRLHNLRQKAQSGLNASSSMSDPSKQKGKISRKKRRINLDRAAKRHCCFNFKSGDKPVIAIESLPHEILSRIFSNLIESGLCRVASVCRTFYRIANDAEFWRKLYQSVFEYDLPLYHVAQCEFEFRGPEMWPCDNPWKESFRMLHHGLHVRRGFSNLYEINGSRNMVHFDSIETAIRYAEGLERPSLIFLHAGHYLNENIVIKTDVQIIGAAPGKVAENVIIERNAENTVALTYGAHKAYLGYCTVKFTPDPMLDLLHHSPFAIYISDSCSPTIDHCVIRSSSIVGTALAVRKAQANPTIRHCCISDCKCVCVYVADHARGTFEDNDIGRNSLVGVVIRNHANPYFRRCQINSGRYVGVFVCGYGQGYFEACDISCNGLYGVEVEDNGNPTIVRCQIHHGRSAGIYIYDDGRGQYLENKVFKNNFAGIWIESKSDPTIRKNEIFDGKQDGIYIFGEGRSLIEYNDIHSNASAGIQIRSKSDPIVRSNKIHNCQHGGVYVHDGGKGLIEENEIYANTLAGIRVTRSAPILRRNRIHSGKHVGVRFYDFGHGCLEENDIFNHVYSCIQIKNGSNPEIRRNKISAGQNGGVLIYAEGFGLLEENEIFDNAMAGVLIETDGDPILRKNKIFNGRDHGVCIYRKGKGLLEENEIFHNAKAGILVSTISNPIINRNRIFDGLAAGIEVMYGATATLTDNYIYQNRFGGLFLATGVTPTMKNNHISGNFDALEKTVEKGQCLFKISGCASFPMHDFFRCYTCNTTDRNAICSNCVRSCHQNHRIEFVRRDRFFCDCGAGLLEARCKLEIDG